MVPVIPAPEVRRKQRWDIKIKLVVSVPEGITILGTINNNHS